uniref:Uncharacterized protein n=1 Tax=Rhizophora mucronata TaxID=61149 RepID=A0A2P2NTQ7_RHIMU
MLCISQIASQKKISIFKADLGLT